MSIEIRDGKLYKDGLEVKPTFGDKEQIEALISELKKKEAQERREKVQAFFKKHENEISERFVVECLGKQEALFYMKRAYDIIIEITSK